MINMNYLELWTIPLINICFLGIIQIENSAENLHRLTEFSINKKMFDTLGKSQPNGWVNQANHRSQINKLKLEINN